MNQHNSLQRPIASTLLILLLLLIGSCGSTYKSSDEAECRPQNTEECATEESGEDRGYDPCLVNASLPVCKT